MSRWMDGDVYGSLRTNLQRLSVTKRLVNMRSLRINRFAKQLGYARSNSRELKEVLRILEDHGFIKVQQSGFLGDSLHHKRIIVILKPFELDNFKKTMLAKTNYKIGEFIVHKTKKQRKCNRCRGIIHVSERYGSKVKFIRKTWRRPGTIKQEILCFPCLLEKSYEEGFEVL